VDPVSWDRDRRDVSTAGEGTDLADYEVLWNGRDPNPTWTLDSGVVWVWWVGDTSPAKKRDRIRLDVLDRKRGMRL